MTEELIVLEENNLNLSQDLTSKQESFIKNLMGKVVNNAINIGLKYVLPDLIEDEVIKVKDAIIENGFKEGLNEAVSTAINFGKTAIGIITGNFENMEQVDIAIKKGGMIDTVSDVLDKSISNAQEKNFIEKESANIIKNNKNIILDNISEQIENTMKKQIKNVEKIKIYSNKWKEAFESQNFNEMSKSYRNLNKYLKETIPLENIIKDARRIENLHNLIKNKNEKFNLTEDEIKLSEKLIN